MPNSPLAREVVKGSWTIHAEEKKDIARVEFPISSLLQSSRNIVKCLRVVYVHALGTGICVLALGVTAMYASFE